MSNRKQKHSTGTTASMDTKPLVSRRVSVCGYCGSSLDPQSWLPTEETEELQQLRNAGQFDLVEGACCIMSVRLYP